LFFLKKKTSENFLLVKGITKCPAQFQFIYSIQMIPERVQLLVLLG
jgi:hypothetical protein